MLPHQERVVSEKLELDQKLQKLTEFTHSGLYYSLPSDERDRLCNQKFFMKGYSEILGERVLAFAKESEQ